MMQPRDRVHEQVLLLRCQSGDREAFAQLFERYNSPLKYYLRRLLDPSEMAEDVLQTVWLKVLRGVKGLRRLDTFRAWLYQIARNEAIDQLRRSRRWEGFHDPSELADASHSTDDGFREFAAARIHDAIVRLSMPHREVLALRFLGDLSYEEISSVVGCELGTVRSRLYYAKRALRQLLEEQNDDG